MLFANGSPVILMDEQPLSGASPVRNPLRYSHVNCPDGLVSTSYFMKLERPSVTSLAYLSLDRR